MHKPPHSIDLPTPAATAALGGRLGRALESGLVVALLGDLGAGKTAISKAAIEALGEVEADDVVSPTFMIAIEYPGRVGVLHVDAYRLEDGQAFDSLGFGELEAMDRATLIEWADRITTALPADHLEIELEHAPGDTRRARLRAHGPRSQAALDKILASS